ncbi:MAG TPA: hypothetical protein VG365_09215 [Solirubrobacteraceae bacterium]|jgi:hypothetical protein|nr:hypothetical protein [Solirubrobacteraceae bacterium]
MDETSRPDPPKSVVDYVAEHAPELDPGDVNAFMDEHPKPADEPDSHVGWAVRILRERGEGEVGEGLGVDRVVDEIRRLDR